MMYKVLLADDERIILDGISSMIEWNSFGTSLIGAAQNGIDAYRLIMEKRSDIVISDIKMPGMGGLELIEKVSRDHPSIRFILLTGFGQFEYAKKAMSYGVRHYLLKPCNESHITDSLQSVIGELKKEESAQKVKTDLEMMKPHLMKQMLKELITGGGIEDEACLRLFSEQKAIRLILFSVRDGEDKEYAQGVESIADEVLNGAVIASARVQQLLVCAVDGTLAPAVLEEKMKSVQELSRRLLRFEPEASLSESGNISEASAMYEKAYRKIVQDEGETSVLIGRMLDLIEKEASNPKLSLKWAARNMLYMNPDYLGKLFKQETGEKFSSYVAKVRIEKAIAKMKKSKNTAIGTLAEELGFGHNPKYFSLVFKKYTGLTPSEFRKKEDNTF
ncbi:DNA-binding response regulator [Bacillus licheniformis]|nr:putative response regulatory protein [Bacillus licheniformis]ARW53542.1 putative transcriptional regulatory protein YesN [Bacillus licheniformis]AXF88266.1 response regulator [Bacillus licheniformis]OIS73155.1 DNA-binding response regulator [Bacillus licheniformis]OIS78893.1 DNA-binding response regulator [Bacillus licheniformis]